VWCYFFYQEWESQRERRLSQLPPEPGAGSPDVIHVVLRSTGGERLERNFFTSDKLQMVVGIAFNFVCGAWLNGPHTQPITSTAYPNLSNLIGQASFILIRIIHAIFWTTEMLSFLVKLFTCSWDY
jgi:hypothetical protein